MTLLFLSSNPRELKRLFVVICLLLAWTAPAAQVKLDSLVARGRTYTNVTVLTYNTTHVFFTYQDGSASVKLRDLVPELQERFNYDPAAAAEAEKQQAADEARYQESLAAKMEAQAQKIALAERKAAATSAESVADPVSDKSLLGKRAPAIEGGKWLGEKPALEGKVVLVVFWAPWSIPCRKYLPTLAGLQKKFADKLAVVGVTCDSEAEVEDMPAPKPGIPTMLDADAKFSVSVGVTSVPYVMLVDAKGIVRYQGHPAAITEKQVEGMLPKAAE